jgi:hypothetical protein
MSGGMYEEENEWIYIRKKPLTCPNSFMVLLLEKILTIKIAKRPS